MTSTGCCIATSSVDTIKMENKGVQYLDKTYKMNPCDLYAGGNPCVSAWIQSPGCRVLSDNGILSLHGQAQTGSDSFECRWFKDKISGPATVKIQGQTTVCAQIGQVISVFDQASLAASALLQNSVLVTGTIDSGQVAHDQTAFVQVVCESAGNFVITGGFFIPSSIYAISMTGLQYTSSASGGPVDTVSAYFENYDGSGDTIDFTIGYSVVCLTSFIPSDNVSVKVVDKNQRR